MKRPASEISPGPENNLRDLWQLTIPVPKNKEELSLLTSALAAQQKIIHSLYDDYVTRAEEIMKMKQEQRHLGCFMKNLSVKNREGLAVLKEAEKRIISAIVCDALGGSSEREKESPPVSSEASPCPPKKKKRVARKAPVSNKQKRN